MKLSHIFGTRKLKRLREALASAKENIEIVSFRVASCHAGDKLQSFSFFSKALVFTQCFNVVPNRLQQTLEKKKCLFQFFSNAETQIGSSILQF